MNNEEYMAADLGSEYLAHHGILGMRWGEKNGPPYPLDAEGKKAIKEQRKAARKEKVEQVKKKAKEYRKKRILSDPDKIVKYSSELTKEEIDEANRKLNSISETRKIIKNSSHLTKKQRDMAKDADKLLKNMDKFTPEEMKLALDILETREKLKDKKIDKIKEPLKYLTAMSDYTKTVANMFSNASSIKNDFLKLIGQDIAEQKKDYEDKIKELKKDSAEKDRENKKLKDKLEDKGSNTKNTGSKKNAEELISLVVNNYTNTNSVVDSIEKAVESNIKMYTTEDLNKELNSGIKLYTTEDLDKELKKYGISHSDDEPYYTASDIGSEYLAHHGILGMKWGEKNGPPYPLDAEGKKAIKEQRKAARKEKAEQSNPKIKEIDDGFFKTLEIKNKDFSIIADPKAVKDKNDFIKASKELPNIDKLLKNSIMSNSVFKSINSDYFNGTISPQDLKFVNSNYSGSKYPIELAYSVNNNLSNGIDFIVVQWDRKNNKISNSKNAIYVEG